VDKDTIMAIKTIPEQQGLISADGRAEAAGSAAGSGRRSSSVSRRGVLGRAGTAAVSTAAAGVLGAVALDIPSTPALAAEDLGPAGRQARADRALAIRLAAAKNRRAHPLPAQPANGDDALYPNHIGSFCKCLPHNDLGEVDPAAYATYLRAIFSGRPVDWDAITLGGASKLSNPQAAYTYELEGPDSHQLYLDPAPAFSSAQTAAEMAEDYWMALARDVPFAAYDSDPLIAQAAADLSRFSDFRGPKVSGAVTPATVFRGPTPGDLTGPYLSQFFWLPVPYGAMALVQRYPVAPSKDFLIEYPAWLANQQGRATLPTAAPGATPPPVRYLSAGRDLASYVHGDFTYQAYLNAALILNKLGAPLDSSPYAASPSQTGFITFGMPHILDYVARAANAALKATWFQKWVVHRRLRPEAFGGRVHNHLTGAARYPIHADLLHASSVLSLVQRRYGSYLLPQAYPEGAPAHPSYPAGHAAIAGSCATVLKAFFDESFVLPAPVLASTDGQRLDPYAGTPLTVGGELNKLAANIALGRDMAGVHWRTDGLAGLRLGEAVAIGILQDRTGLYSEDFHGFSLTAFDGTTLTV
jgi:hypothetical protein